MIGNFCSRFIKKYAKTHEWIDIANEVAKIGISSYAARHLGEITWISINENEFRKGDEIGTIEASKTVMPIIAPCNLKIIEVNKNVEEKPKSLVISAEGKGYLAKVKVDEPVDISDLMEKKDYLKYLSTLE